MEFESPMYVNFVSFRVLVYSHGQELFYNYVSNFTNKLVKQLLSMTVCTTCKTPNQTLTFTENCLVVDTEDSP